MVLYFIYRRTTENTRTSLISGLIKYMILLFQYTYEFFITRYWNEHLIILNKYYIFHINYYLITLSIVFYLISTYVDYSIIRNGLIFFKFSLLILII